MRFDKEAVVQFGEHLPISLEEARRRTRDNEARLRERHGVMGRLEEVDEERWRRGRVDEWQRLRGGGGNEGEGRRETAPYPETSLIPTEEGIVRDTRPRGRESGSSQKDREEAVGLGFKFG